MSKAYTMDVLTTMVLTIVVFAMWMAAVGRRAGLY
jgi:hypothetical protein